MSYVLDRERHLPTLSPKYNQNLESAFTLEGMHRGSAIYASLITAMA